MYVNIVVFYLLLLLFLCFYFISSKRLFKFMIRNKRAIARQQNVKDFLYYICMYVDIYLHLQLPFPIIMAMPSLAWLFFYFSFLLFLRYGIKMLHQAVKSCYSFEITFESIGRYVVFLLLLQRYGWEEVYLLLYFFFQRW